MTFANDRIGGWFTNYPWVLASTATCSVVEFDLGDSSDSSKGRKDA